jgi:Holliday junction resolvase RusA-like endonuclease
MNKINILIKEIPPSVNSLHKYYNGRVITPSSVKTFKTMVQNLYFYEMNKFVSGGYDYYKVKLFFYLPNIIGKNGKINQKAGDVDNMAKCLIDALFNKSGEDDSKITEITLVKLPGKERITIGEIEGFFFRESPII